MASNNDAFLRSLGDIYQRRPPNLVVSFDYKDCRIQCFPHVLNTCVKHTIKALNNGIDIDTRGDAGDGKDDEGSDEDGEDEDGSDEDESGDDSDSRDQSPGNLLNKARGLIQKIHSSGQRSERFTNIIKGGNQYGWWKDPQGSAISIRPRQLLRDVKTRWDSTYQMLVRLQEFCQVSLL